MYSDPLAYFLTYTTYGTWLHGRETGSVDQQHNAYDTPVLAPDAELEQRQRSKMKQPEYRLDGGQRAIVLETILEVANHRKWYVWAAHVRSNHVHVVISAKAKPEKVLNDLKAWSSRRLKERLGEPPDRQRWTHHGSTRYIFNEDVLAEKIKYVLEEQGERMAWFSADFL
jgi:REP element-mobilizing transposase RayT